MPLANYLFSNRKSSSARHLNNQPWWCPLVGQDSSGIGEVSSNFQIVSILDQQSIAVAPKDFSSSLKSIVNELSSYKPTHGINKVRPNQWRMVKIAPSFLKIHLKTPFSHGIFSSKIDGHYVQNLMCSTGYIIQRHGKSLLSTSSHLTYWFAPN